MSLVCMHGVMYCRYKYASMFVPINTSTLTTTFVESKLDIVVLKFDFVSMVPFHILLHNFSIIANEVNR